MTSVDNSLDQVHFLNVGQAHATIATQANAAIVVDCPSTGVAPATAILDDIELTYLAIFVTHRDLDHCGGVHELLRRYGAAPTKLYMNAAMSLSSKSDEQKKVKAVIRSILGAAEESGSVSRHALQGDSDSVGQMKWHALAPTHQQVLRTAAGGSVNRSSMVLILEVGDLRYLLPGDIDDNAVDRLIDSGFDLSATVFLLPHHGARLHRLDDLLALVDPQYAVISSGRRASHPALETLAKVVDHGCRVMCTQVTAHCHRPSSQPITCADSIVFSSASGSPTVSPSSASHELTIRSLDTPVCIQG